MNKNYPLEEYQSSNLDKIVLTIQKFPLAMLISQQDNLPMVSQIPLIHDRVKDRLILRGHFDRNSPHSTLIKKEQSIYCVFNGPNHYISPSIYRDEQYPGWNYIAVHIEGKIQLLEEETTLRKILLRLAKENETPLSTYQLNESQSHFDLFVKGIIGFEIEVIKARGIFKLAQNKSPENIERAKEHLVELIKEDHREFFEVLLK